MVIGLPNDMHVEAAMLAAQAGKAVLCTKPLGHTVGEAEQILDAVEKAGVFGGYLEDLVYPPKTLKALDSVKNGALGWILWVRSRETHTGAAQRLVLGCEPRRRGRDSGYGMSLHRDHPQFHRQWR